MKHYWMFVLAAITTIVILACSLIESGTTAAPDAPTVGAPTSEVGPLAVATQSGSESATEGTPFAFPGGSLVIPPRLGGGASAEIIPAVDEQSGAPWDVAPEYVKISLQGYPLEGKFFQPQLMIYPAAEYSAGSEAAAQSIQSLQAMLANPSGVLDEHALPHLPFANAAQVFAAQMQPISFKSGQGVRSLTEYAQYVATINNHDLFYHFQGLTGFGEYYVVAILPINAAFLSAGSDPASPLPAGGIPFPGYETADESQFDNYYRSVAALLNSTAPDQFTPSLASLDALIQSLEVTK
jgi:hypothetical protein